ncbi:MAG: TonB-dependent receptor [Candidatus Kapabacteria bacterium]|nr:TonB-dependent receptor [Candidatus Kapabacteria bacterium]
MKRTFPEVKVTATRILSNSLAEFSPNTMISKSEIQRLSHNQISEAMLYMPGLFIKDYGGLGGMKTVSLRGTSANQTLIMINGIRLNSNQTGMTDLSNIPLSFIGSMEIVRSGVSAVYGGNAIGGVVNILPDNEKSDKASFLASYGSFNENFLAINAVKNFNKFNLNTSIEYKHSDGNYPIDMINFGNEITVGRSNAMFTNYSAAINANYNLNNTNISLYTLVFDSKRGVPGAVLQGQIESKTATLSERGVLVSASSQHQFSKNLSLNAGLSARYNDMNYQDRNMLGLGGKPLDNDFISNEYNFSTTLKNEYKKSTSQIIVEAFHSSLKGDMLQPGISTNPFRNGFATSFIFSDIIEIFENWEINHSEAIRLDIFSDNSPAYSPFIGLIINPVNSDFFAKLNVSANFRMPNFNELYYLNYGTADLKPEKSKNFNAGICYKSENFNFEINAFANLTDDLIIAVPRSPAVWSAKNIGKALTQGIELVSEIEPEKYNFKINLNYTYQSAREITEGSINNGNLLVYVPQELINANIYYIFPLDFSFAVNFNYTSFRYSLQSNDISSVLPEYFTLNLKISKSIVFSNYNINLFTSADNITNERYSVVRNFPMPGRLFRIGASFGV